MYNPSLAGLTEVLGEQNQGVESQGKHISYVVWAGQFSDSIPVHETGQNYMNKWPVKPKYIYQPGTA